MRNCRNFAILFLMYFCHFAYAKDELANLEIASNKNAEVKEKRSANHQELATVENASGRPVKKRQSEYPSFFTAEYCKLQGYCGLTPVLSTVCLVKCNFEKVAVLKPFLSLISELPMSMCQAVSTIFPSIPRKIQKYSEHLSNVKSYLKLLHVKKGDEAGFAKTSVNALPVTFVKNLKGPIYDDLKPAIKMLEIRDVDEKIRTKVNSRSKLLGSLLPLGTGQFFNEKCDKTNLDDEALRLIAAMKLRLCNLDVLMPGYFVFNAAPKVASNREISPLLKAFNLPLLMFTGVKCCMVKYAIHNVRSKCINDYELLSNPQGLVISNGPDTVCNAIPTFSPIIPPPKATFASAPTAKAAGSSETVDGQAEEASITTTVSPCEGDDKGELEECVTEQSLVEYSEEAVKEATIASGNNTIGESEEIQSDETEY